VGSRACEIDPPGGGMLDVETAHLKLHLGVHGAAVGGEIRGRHRRGRSEQRQLKNGRDGGGDDRPHQAPSVAQRRVGADLGKCFHIGILRETCLQAGW
jgi:hypothetical protein